MPQVRHSKPRLVIVTPALAAAKNGNAHTALRWARFLRPEYRVRVVERWTGGAELAMIALHARRSAPSVAAWRAAHARGGLAVVLTGTDLYRDLATDAAAQASIATADRLVVLQALGIEGLPAPLRAKASVSVQSARTLAPRRKTDVRLRVLAVGHLRDEKSPRTLWAAARLLAHRSDVAIDHIGRALQPELAAEALATQAACPRYRWLGGLAHGATRARIAAAHLLVHPSTMEGGAHVIIEAITSGTPVVASRIDGNVGLLGAGYEGLFATGDAAALARWIERCRDQPATLERLAAACAARADRFAPAAECERVRALAQALVHEAPLGGPAGAA